MDLSPRMKVRVSVTLSVLADGEHRQQVRQSAAALTDDLESVEIEVAAEDPRKVIASFTVPTAPQDRVVDRIGREFWNWVHDYSYCSIGFSPSPRRATPRKPARQAKTVPALSRASGDPAANPPA